MRVVFMGFQTWGYETLKALLETRHTVPLVCTHPESSHPYEAIWNDSVKTLAQDHGIPVIEQTSIKKASVAEMLRAADPDIFVLSDWRTWLSPETYTIPKFGSINVHDGLLPKYGGFAPINWAIANGETVAGVTVHAVNEQFDAGDIILQQEIPIAFTETATNIFYKIIPVVVQLTIKALDLIESGQVRPIPQKKCDASFFHKRSERESLISWQKTPLEIYNLIRAQSDPYPNAFTYHLGKKLKVKKASLPDICYCGTPGRVFCRQKMGVVVLGAARSVHENQGIVLEVVENEHGECMEANRYFKKMGDYLGL